MAKHELSPWRRVLYGPLAILLLGTTVGRPCARAASLSIDDVVLLEGNSTDPAARTYFVFTVQIDQPVGTDVGFEYEVLSGGGPFPADPSTDFDAPPGPQPLSLPAGSINVTISVPVIPDTEFETSEWFRVILSSVVGADLSDGVGIGRIDNDDVYLWVNSLAVNEGHGETPVEAVFEIHLLGCSSPPCTYEFPVQVSYATQDFSAVAGEDYEPTAGMIELSPGETGFQLLVAIVGDIRYEPTERFSLDLQADNATAPAAPAAYCDILNDDPRFTITNASAFEGDSGLTVVEIPVYLTDCGSADCGFPLELTVDWETTGAGSATAGIDYVHPSQGTVVFPVGESLALIPVEVIGDLEDEQDETFDVRLLNSDSIAGAGLAVVTILNDDTGVGVDPLQETTRIGLRSILPNPSGGMTFIRYELPSSQSLKVSIYDLAGRRLKSLVNGTEGAGSHSIGWDGLDDGGRSVASGVYFIRMETAGYSETQKVVRVR